MRQRFYLDATWWDHGDEDVPHLHTLQQALWQDRKVDISYTMLQGIAMTQTVAPLGLVAKAGVWYLVYVHTDRVSVQRVSRLSAVAIATESFARPDGFDLAAFWQQWCADHDKGRTLYTVTLRVAPSFVAALPLFFGERAARGVATAGAPDATGYITLDLSFESLYAARERILACGGGVEVMSPEPLRLSVLDFATQIVGLYAR